MRKQKISFRILWENFVFKEWSYYYKMPSFVWKNIFYTKNDSYNQAVKNFDLIKKYFWKVIKIAQTEIMKNDDWHYIIKQKAIEWTILSMQDLEENYLLRSKFRKLVIINEIMWEKEWVFLDLLWSDFVYKPTKINNLIVKWNEIFIFDFGLLEKKPKNFLFKFVSTIAQKIQIFIILKFWDK